MWTVRNKRNYTGDGVYVGRPSLLGNPYVVGKKCIRCDQVHSDNQGVVDCYRDYFYTRIKDKKFYQSAKAMLEQSQNIICWCSPKPCHADVLKEWAENGFPKGDLHENV